MGHARHPGANSSGASTLLTPPVQLLLIGVCLVTFFVLCLCVLCAWRRYGKIITQIRQEPERGAFLAAVTTAYARLALQAPNRLTLQLPSRLHTVCDTLPTTCPLQDESHVVSSQIWKI